MPSGQNAGKAPAAQNNYTYPFPPCSTWHSVEILGMLCTVDDHRRHCCRLLKKIAGSPNSACRARSDSCIDNVDHQQLLDCVFSTMMSSNYIKRLGNYQFACIFLISQQFAIACHLPQHPCHQICHRPSDGWQDQRRSLIVRLRPDIQQYLAEEQNNLQVGHQQHPPRYGQICH